MRSLLDLNLPPLVDAERQLADLSDQRTQRLIGAVALTSLAAGAAVVIPQLWIVLTSGAVAALVTAAWAFTRRRALLSALVATLVGIPVLRRLLSPPIRNAYGVD